MAGLIAVQADLRMAGLIAVLTPKLILRVTLFFISPTVYFETYGCQMNVNDTEIAWSVLKDAGFMRTPEIHDVKQAGFVIRVVSPLPPSPPPPHSQADVILAVTCAIRENAEKKVWSRLDFFKSLKRKRPSSLPPLKVGLLGKRWWVHPW